MRQNAAEFFTSLKGKRIAVIGIGVSHRELIPLLCKSGASVTVCDKRTKAELGDDYPPLREAGAAFSLGDGYLDALTDADMIIRTPGFYFYHPALTAARKAGKVVTSEMELFFDFCPCKTYAVTGTDGKTTTTTIISKLLTEAGKTVYLGGNIGRALLPIADQMRQEDIAVVELSSFQLLSMRPAPDVSAITNVMPDHLNVHSGMEEYIDAKCNIFRHQNAFSRTVLNLDNDITRGLGDGVRGTLCHFSRREVPENGAFLDENGDIFYNEYGKRTFIMPMSEIRLPGLHNVENYLTAITAVWGEVSVEQVRQVARSFTGVEHRIEFVRELDGVSYYNDSIATSPVSTIAGLRAFDRRLIVIAGGSDKNLPFEPLAPELCAHAKLLILTGATAPKIEAAVLHCPDYPTSGLVILHADSMEDAVALARSHAESGDIVTLSPASASFDRYRNFEERGRHFKQIVNAL